MTAGTLSPTTSEELAQLVEEIWSSLLVDVEPLMPVFDPDPAGPTANPWSAQVSIEGEWHGVIRIDLDLQLAEALTARMLGTHPGDADLEDAMGELANVIGGNVKSLLPGEGHLSLPQAGRPLPAVHGTTVCRSDHIWAEHRLSVRVLVPTDAPREQEEAR